MTSFLSTDWAGGITASFAVGSRDKLGRFTLSHDRGGGNRCSGHGSMPGYTPSAASLVRLFAYRVLCLAMLVAPSTFNYCHLDDFFRESIKSHFVIRVLHDATSRIFLLIFTI